MLPFESPFDAPHPGAALVAAAFFLTAGVLARALPKERRSILAASGLFVVSLVVGLSAGALHALGHPGAAQALLNAGILLEGLCGILLVGMAVFRVALPSLGVQQPRILQDVVVTVASMVWGLTWLRLHGVDLTSLLATSAVLTAVIGFAMQDTLGNILGGMAVQLDQSVRVGDWVRIGDVEGRVVEIHWRQTALETRDWETVIIPNSVLSKNQFKILGRRQGEPVQLRRTVRFFVDYRQSPTQVIEVVTQTLRAARIPGVALEPQPDCVLTEIVQSEAGFAVRYWLTNLAVDEPTDSEVRIRIWTALDRAGIPLSIPAQAVFLTQETSARKSRKAAAALDERAAALQSVDLFRALQPDELIRLAEGLERAPFAAGERLMRQGEEADCLYLILSGQVEVLVEDGSGHSTPVAELGPGSFLGEMGLITGEPRSATALALTRVSALRLGHRAFEELLQSRPEVAEEVATALAVRKVGLAEAREQLSREARRRAVESTRGDLLRSMRAFFNLDRP
ncbi:MAG: cyclic nucleotide-binding domain-containing protein [Armatimonadota bacterium]